MKITMGAVSLIFVGILGWFVGSRLSPDAVGMAVGVIFGILAGIPAALLVLISHRQTDHYRETHTNSLHNIGRGSGRDARSSPKDQMPYAPQQPLIVFVGNSTPQQLNQPIGGYSPSAYNQHAYNPIGVQQPATQYFDLGPADSNPATHSPAANGPATNGPATNGQPNNRQFRVVGEEEEWIQEWS